MMTIIDLARNIRKRHGKPLKTPPSWTKSLQPGIDPQVMSADTALDEDASSGSGNDMNMTCTINKRQTVAPGSGRRKRSRKATGDVIVVAMLEIAAASKMRATAIIKKEERFSISKCRKVLDEMQDVDQHLYFFALDLFENSNAKETFISLKSERRLTWLLNKFNASSSAAVSQL